MAFLLVHKQTVVTTKLLEISWWNAHSLQG